MSRKAFLLLSLMVILSLAMPACTAAGGSNQPSVIKVGALAELTGEIPAVGATFKRAAEMAVDEVNQAGGLKVGNRTYQVELVIEDDATQSDKTIAATRKLITQDNVVAIIGPTFTSYAIPAAEVAESAKVTLITTGSTNPKTTLNENTGTSKEYVFRACFTDPFQGRVVAKYAMNTMGARKAAVLFNSDNDYNKGIAEIFKSTFEAAGGTMVAYETYTTGATDYTTQLNAIKDATPDVIFLPNYYDEVPVQIQQARKLGISVPFLGSDSAGNPELLRLCGADCEGFSFSTHYAVDSASDAAGKFIASYKERYGENPDAVAALTYDSFTLLWQALQSAGKVDRQAVRDALAKIPRFEGVTGSMQFQPGSGDPIKSAVILQVKNGAFVFAANANP